METGLSTINLCSCQNASAAFTSRVLSRLYFEATNFWPVILVLAVMLISSSWISMRTMKIDKKKLLGKSLAAIFIGGVPVLILITQGVLGLNPWYLPSYMIPLAGMIFANAMNSISLAGERLESEVSRGELYEKARVIALNAALIPITNSLLAVGLVSLPGMMTGQILSGVEPFIAASYQIMVMCMIFGSTGISVTVFLTLLKEIIHFKFDYIEGRVIYSSLNQKIK